MNPNQEKQQNEDGNPPNMRRIRRGPNSGRALMPEPDNIVPTVAASVPTFRAMAVQNRGPQLMMPPTSVVAKAPPLAHSPYYETEMKSPKQMQREPEKRELLLLSTETQERFGWDTSQIQIQNLPMYFPRDMIHWEFSTQDLPVVLGRISEFLRASSVQACFIETPLSAKLQTCRENAELYLVFFNEPSGMVSMSVQRHKGDNAAGNKCIRRLVDAAKGILGENDNDSNKADAPVSANAVLAMERLIERCAAESAAAQDGTNMEQNHPFLSQTPEQITASAVRDVYGWLEQSNRLDMRRRAFEYLLAMTDLKRTLSATAIATANIVLQGGVPSSTSPELNTHAQGIQSILLSVLLTRELPGDRAMFGEAGSNDNRDNDDIEMRPYFPEMDKDVTSSSTGLPQHYNDYMNELFHLALRIFVQSLEVLSCFRNQHSDAGDNLAKQLFAMAEGKDLYNILLGCVCHAESKLANGYLACKALRLLASNHPGIKDQIKCDDNAKQSIGNAYQVGGMCHELLKDESYQLWQCVSQ
jgi:hypothetical protein